MRLFALAALLAAVPVCAQGIARYIPDADPATGSCNVIPFGNRNTSATWVNQRYQTVATAAQLANTPGLVTGLRFAACNTGIHESRTIRITLAHVPAGFSVLTNTNFDNNLNVLGSNATVVLDQTGYRWRMTDDNWSSIGFDGSFVYNGSDDLLVDILVTGNNTTGGSSSSSMHTGAVSRLYATNWVGSPPATGTTGSAALKMGVEFGCSGLSTFGAGCDGVALDLSGSATLGGSFTAALSGGEAALPVAVFFGTQTSAPFPVDLTAFGFAGCRLYTDSAASAFGSASVAGTFSVTLGVPASASLIGAQIYAQGAAIKLTAPGGGASSNAGRILFGSDC